jgi:hypothetical protein
MVLNGIDTGPSETPAISAAIRISVAAPAVRPGRRRSAVAAAAADGGQAGPGRGGAVAAGS